VPRHALAGGVPHDEAQASIFVLEEVVEVATNLPSRLVVSRYLPAVELGGRLGKELPLDLASDLQLLLDAFPLPGLPNARSGHLPGNG
jgi:hypothetical protein